MKSISDSYKDDYDDEMLTTTTTVNAQKRQPKMIAKWSGSDEPQSYYEHEDTDTVTLTVSEVRRIQGYYANSQRKWRNDDDE